MFINTRIHTDVTSLKVLSVNGKTALVVRVVKNPKNLVFVPGGFAGHCCNQEEAFRNAEIEEVGEPFEVVLRNGVWGRWVNESRAFFGVSDAKVQEILSSGTEAILEITKEDDGTNTIVVAEVSPKTKKPKRRFMKFGVMEETCKYFYDYNF